MGKVTTALRPKSRKFWGKPKPIEVSDLKVGDLAFARFRHNLDAGLASMATGYSPMHVSLYIGNGKFFGLSERARIPFAESMFTLYPNPFIFRPKLSQAQAEKIVLLAKQMAKDKVHKGKGCYWIPKDFWNKGEES